MLMPGRSGSLIQGEWTEGGNAVLAHLTVDDRIGNQPVEYVATESIEFLPGFESSVGDAFVAYIDPEARSGNDAEGSGLYRYGFNGQEKSDEIKGDGNSYTAEFWEYDSRLGRRWNLDPKPMVGISEYAAFANNPILFSDPLGDTIVQSAGGAHSVDIDEKVHSLEFYQSSRNTIRGTSTPVPAQAGQLRSFTNALGKFTAKWRTDNSGNAIFAGYLNDKNQSYDVILRNAVAEVSGWKGNIMRFGSFMRTQVEADPYFPIKLAVTMTTMSATAAVDPVPYTAGLRRGYTSLDDLSSLGTLNFTQKSLSLVTKYPSIPSISRTIENIHLMPGDIIDRFGPLSGKWFSTPGTPYGSRSIPPGLSPYTRFKVLKPFEVQKSLSSPGMFSGQSGYGVQYQSPVGINILIKRKIIAPL